MSLDSGNLKSTYKQLIGFYIFIGISFILLSLFILWVSRDPPWMREAGISIVSAIIGGACFSIFEHTFMKKEKKDC
jgi:pilus assembly protein TadC